MRAELNVTCGTDVVLNVRLLFKGVTFDASLSSCLEANLISGLGHRTSLPVEVTDGEVTVTVPWVTGRHAGRHGLELRGMLNGLRWSTVADGLINYTLSTVPGTSPDIVMCGDGYDITLEVGYRYGETPIERVEASVDGGIGEPSVDVSYVSKVLSLSLHNIKGVQGDEGKSAYEVAVANGYQGTEAEWLASLKGIKGDQGDSAAYVPDEGEELAPLFLANVLGNSTVKGMTQKAITEATNITLLSYTAEELTALPDRWGIRHPQSGNDYWDNSTTYRGRVIPLYENGEPIYAGCTVLISPSGEATTAKAAFITALGKTPYDEDDRDVEYAEGCALVEITEDYMALIPSDAQYLYLSKSESSTKPNIPQRVAIVQPYKDSIPAQFAQIESALDGKIDDLKDRIEEVEENLSSAEIVTLLVDALDNTGSATIIGSWRIVDDTWQTTNNNYTTKQIDAVPYRGKTLRITPARDRATTIAFTINKGSSPSSVEDEVVYSGIEPYSTLVTIENNKTIEVLVPGDANYLFFSTYRGGAANTALTPTISLVESRSIRCQP